MELDDPSIEFTPAVDRRPHMPEPLPVTLVAIEDVQAQAGAGLEVQLDQFYVNLLRFERQQDVPRESIVYRAENYRLCFEVVEPPVPRDGFRPIGVDVPSLGELEQQLIEREIECHRSGSWNSSSSSAKSSTCGRRVL
jgi:hypothetical protein